MIEEYLSLDHKTSYKVGGEARYYCCPTTETELLEALEFQKEKSLALFVLGKGSNILVSDSGFDGIVLDLSSFVGITHKENRLTSLAGTQLTKFVMKSVELGLQGMEDLAGIPGSVGGGVLMNAGAYSQTISDCLESVRWLDLDRLEIFESVKDELEFGYRFSSFKKRKSIILSTTFLLSSGEREKLKEQVMMIQQKRRDKQPLNYPSCGSVFKRPPNNYAGALIEKAGLKGYKIGGAQVSEKHANFIINTGEATAKDIISLISHCQKTVFTDSGILLEPEVILVGNFVEGFWKQ